MLFYELFAHRLTIIVRDFWDEPASNDRLKIEQMKWVNEIQHRVTSKIRVERLQLHDWPESDFIKMISHYVKQCPSIASEVAWCIKDSYERVEQNTANNTP